MHDPIAENKIRLTFAETLELSKKRDRPVYESEASSATGEQKAASFSLGVFTDRLACLGTVELQQPLDLLNLGACAPDHRLIQRTATL